MDFSLLEVFSGYQTTLCVFLIVISVSILWIYVTIIRGKAVEPNFDVLYEKSTTHTAGSKKPVKNKAKGKHVEGSPKPGKAKTVAEVSGSNQPKEKESSKKQPTTKTQNTSKKQASKRKSRVDARVESNTSPESENEGGWQTQLSRPQLRALRQMQKKAKEAGVEASGHSQAGVGREGSSSSSSGGGADSSGDGRQSEKEKNTKSSKGQKKKGKQAARRSPDIKVTDTSVGTASDEGASGKTSADTGASGQDPQEVGSTNGESSGEGAATVEGGSSSSSFPVTCNSSVQDVEGALREAAQCSSSTSRHEIVTTQETVTSQEQPNTTKTIQKRKRAKRKNKQQQDKDGGSSKAPVTSVDDNPPSESGRDPSKEERPPSVGRESGDDWVIIDN